MASAISALAAVGYQRLGGAGNDELVLRPGPLPGLVVCRCDGGTGPQDGF